MKDLFTVLFGTSLFILLLVTLGLATSNKDLKHREEYKVGLAGAFTFMYVSWLVIFIANTHPFVKPEFTKEKPPAYYKK